MSIGSDSVCPLPEVSIASSALTKRCSKLPRKGGCGEPSIVVTEDIAVGWSLICPGLGSSISSTKPKAFISRGSSTKGFKDKGVVGGLRDLDRRASSCRKGMGEKRGVLGADCSVEPSKVALRPYDWISLWVRGGKLDHVEVTKIDLSTARRYLPTEV